MGVGAGRWRGNSAAALFLAGSLAACGSWRCDFTVSLMSASVILLAVGRRWASAVGVSADVGGYPGMLTSSAEMLLVVVRNESWIKLIVDRCHAARTHRSGRATLLNPLKSNAAPSAVLHTTAVG